MRALTIIILLFLITLIIGCKSQRLDNSFYFHKDINKKNYPKMLSTAKLPKGDSLWINERTVCVKTGDKRFRVGSIINGQKRGRWYHYYHHAKSDTIDCYVIQNFTHKDSSYLRAISVNRRDF